MNSLKFFTLTFFVIFFSNLKTNAQGDGCNGAFQINGVSNYCSSSGQFTNANSTNGGGALPNCWVSSATNDVWFWFRAIASDVEITVSGDNGAGTIKQPYIELIRDNCIGLSLACSGPQATLQNTSVLGRGGLIPGTDYIIRVATSAANRGTFKLCVRNYVAPLNPGADCDGAIRLCDTNSIFVPALSGKGKKNEIPPNSCFYSAVDPTTLDETNSSWYKWTCETSGTLTFVIDPVNPKNDLDFIVYELQNGLDACGPRTMLRCNATNCVVGPTGLNMTDTDINEPINCVGQSNGFLKYLDMVAGKSYALFINNFDGTSGFTIKWGGTGKFLGPHAVITAGSAPEICIGNDISYEGNLSKYFATLDWVFTGGTPNSQSGIGPFHIDYNMPGVYTTYLYAKDSTCASGNSIDSIKVTINGPPQIDANNPTISSTDCNKPSGSITNVVVNGGNPAYSYEWFKLPSISVSTSTTDADLTGVTAGEYYLIVTDSKSCKDSVGTFKIKPYDPPKTPGVSNNKQYCPYDTLEKIYAEGGGGIYTWYDDADLNNEVHVGPDYLPVNTVTDTLYITETEHGCTSDVDTVVVIIHPLPGAEAGDKKHVTCRLPEVALDASATGLHPLSYSWTPVSEIVSGENTLKPIVKSDGNYTLTVKDDSTGCIKTDVVEVIKDPPPKASFYPSVYSGIDPLEVTFTNTSTNGSNVFEWIFPRETKIFDKDPKFTFINANTYTVMLVASDSSVCPDTAMVQIQVNEKFTYDIPNVFTPNGDGVNDVFTISVTGIEGLYGEIYNRWGLKMFSWDLKNDGWDGRSPAGTAAPEGTYYYVLKIRPRDGGKLVEKQGSLTLLR